MSILEIILYSLLGIGTIIYLIILIRGAIKEKKEKAKEDED